MITLPHTLAIFTALALALNIAVAAADTAFSDQTIATSIVEAWEKDPGIRTPDLQASVEQGVASLSGQTQSFLERERAAEIAATRRGVRSLINQITVAPGPKDDLELAEHVKAALAYDNAIAAENIEVQAENGVIILTGLVYGWSHHNEATRTAGNVSGVTAVRNDLEVKWEDVQRSDQELERHITNLLRYDVWVNDHDLRVKVDNKKVTITGPVSSLDQKERIYSKCWVLGVTDVDASGLRVDPSAADHQRKRKKLPNVSDADIEKALSEALAQDPRVNRSDLDITVRNGSVTLAGKVDRLAAKQAAAQVVADTAGVVDTLNELEVEASTDISDQQQEERIRAALQRHPHLEAYAIDVKVDDAVATLSGTLFSRYDALQAVMTAAEAAGIEDVKDALEVDAPETNPNL